MYHLAIKLKTPLFRLNSVHSSRKVLVRSYRSEKGIFGYKKTNVKTSQEAESILKDRISHGKHYQFVSAYREHGHKVATINPVLLEQPEHPPEMQWSNYDLELRDSYDFRGLIHSNHPAQTVEEAVKYLHNAYCGTISAEFTYVEDFEEREWLCANYEKLQEEVISNEDKLNLLKEMIKSQVLDRFLAKKFVSLKRYGAEGAESMMAFFLQLFRVASEDGVDNIVLGKHHRGRLNLLIGLLNMDPELLFRKIQGKSELPEVPGFVGDVISHLSPTSDISINGKNIKVLLTNLPSHLEAVGPVSLGKTRCMQLLNKESDYGKDSTNNWGDSTINVQVHGDAALMGQGVSQESILLSTLPHFNVGGSIHLIVNNQLGFTTPPPHGRGTRYSSDVAKIISAPVIHVNGEDPEGVIKATRLATKYQRKFRKNIFIDLNCYRRWGHNELDDPTFTNPRLYNIIHSKKTIPDSYSTKLMEEGIITQEDVSAIEEDFSKHLNDCFKRTDAYSPKGDFFNGEWKGFSAAPNAITEWNTGVNEQHLRHIGIQSVTFPESFNVHASLLKNHITGRLQRLQDCSSIDWATAEALAFGSLLLQGYNVRISGQDVGRGTFSHRHAMMVDQKTDELYIPLNNLRPDQSGFLEVANSSLSEEAVLGFEYGFSTMSPHNLVIWEAQFGDFFNGAQIQIDTYITSGECKWFSMSGLVMLLPHGYDGAGPEHSSCRLERFLQLTDSSETKVDGEDVNVHIVNPTTPAQYFHLLRRQLVRNYRKPLIVVGPKILLRSSDATSSLSQMEPGSGFSSVIGDNTISEPSFVQRVIFVSGKHYYALMNYKRQFSINNVAIIRIEELCPFPVSKIQEEVTKYKNAKEFIWSQEEPRNMGAWTFCRPRFENLVGVKLEYAGREAAACPAVGIGSIHKKEAEMVVKSAFDKVVTQSF